MQANWNSSLGSLLIVIGLGWMPGAWAQGLGEMNLGSTINQPFRADIELFGLGDLQASQIDITLASQTEFENAGLTRAVVLNSLQFDVEVNGDGTGVIHVSSAVPIEEPFLNFLMSASWPNGRMLREYTALLDLPTFANNNPTAVTALQPAQTTPAAPAAPTPAPQQPAATAPAATTEEYTVQNGDSMWEIASRMRPSNAVSVQQMMVAIQRANEDAFINNNINRLRSGRVLRIPSGAEISLVDQQTAMAAITQQNQQLAAQPLALNNTQQAANGAQPTDELTLLSGNDSGAGAGSGSDATIAALENELALSEENLDRARLENLELTNRLAALQEQISTLQDLIALEDATIASLQAGLAEQAEATQQALREAETVANNLVNEEAAAQQQTGLAGLLQNFAVLLGGGVALVVLALVVLMARRRNTALADGDTFDFDAAEAEARAAAAATIMEENAAASDTPTESRVTWGAAIAAFFARLGKRAPQAEEGLEEQAAAEVTGGSYGPDAAFRNALAEEATEEQAGEAQVEPVLNSEEEMLAAAAMAEEAFDELEEADEPALSAEGTISYIEPAIVPKDEDLLAEAGDLLAAVTPEPLAEVAPSPPLVQPEQELDTSFEAVLEQAAEPEVVLDQAVEPEVVIAQAAEPEVVLEQVAEPEVVLDALAEPEVVLDELAEPEVVVDQLAEPEVVAEQAAEPEVMLARAEEPEVLKAQVAELAGEEDDSPDIFEFSLKTEPAAETVAAAAEEPGSAELETIEFTPSVVETPTSTHASEYQQVADMEEESAATDDATDMLDLDAFDDTFVADAAEEDSSYMPSTPNNAQDAKLDLAVAYEAMGDIDGAVEILDEVIEAGTDEQIAEAERLKAKWQNS